MTMQSSGEEPSNSASISLEAAANKRKVWIRTLKTVGFAAVIYFFVFPLVPGFRQAFSDLFEVDKTMLVLGVLLEFIGLFCYSLLTRAALGNEGHKMPVMRLFRLQLSTKSLGSIMPGGSAASSALGYRLLTCRAYKGPMQVLH